MQTYWLFHGYSDIQCIRHFAIFNQFLLRKVAKYDSFVPFSYYPDKTNAYIIEISLGMFSKKM